MSTVFTCEDIQNLTPPDVEDRNFLIRLSAKTLASLMETAWVPIASPSIVVTIERVVEEDDGVSRLVIVGENA